MDRVAVLLCLSIMTAACSYDARVSESKDSHNSMEENDGGELHLAEEQIIKRLREKYAERLAGLYVEREQRRIVVRLKGSGSVLPESHKVGSEQLDVVFVPAAAHTVAQLNRIMSDGVEVIQERVPTAHARYVDERTGEIVIAVDEGNELSDDVRHTLSTALGAPVRIVVQGRVVARPAPPNM